MQRKQVRDAGLLAVGSFSLVGWLVPALFKAVGWIEWAQGLGDVFALFADPRISWPGVYLFLSFAAASASMVFHWGHIQRWRHDRARAKIRNWNLTFEQAANYVGYLTHFSEGLNTDDIKRLTEAGLAIMEAVQSGRLSIAGCKNDSFTPTRVPPRELKTLKIAFKVGRSGYNKVDVYNVALVNEVGRKVVYDKIFLDRDEVARIWPRAPERY